MFSLTKKITSTAIAASLLVGSVPFAMFVSGASANENGVPEGFVYANGTRFECDGEYYYYAGTNCYYLTYKSQESVQNVFEDAKAMGLKVIRVWGNMDVGVKTDQINSNNGAPVFTNNNDGSGEKDGIYFQYFDSDLGRPVVNEGEDGLMKLDYAIYQAEQHDMKLLITFTNYWDAFGGMGQYIDWAEQIGLTGLNKDDFYTNETLKGWYKDYIKTLLNHTNPYTGRKLKDEPGVFAWELANEPRCSSDAQCADDTLYNWAKEMSEYVKSIDPYHMVSLGDEGFYNKPYGYYDDYTTSNYVFYGAEGVDFEKLMTIETLDFGTPHLYLDQWGLKHTGEGQDDLLWFRIHGETCAELDKPVILEEFGLTNKSIRDSEFAQWFEVLEGDVYENVEYAGTNYWMIASYIEEDGGSLYPDYDQYTVYGPAGTETETTRQLIMQHAANMQAKNIVNKLDKSSADFDRSNPSDITVSATMRVGEISGVSLNGTSLKENTHYTRSGDTITIKSSYLKTLELSKYTFVIECTEGNDLKFVISVFDNSIEEPVISPTTVSVDLNPRVCKNITISMDKKTSEFRGIKNGNTVLSENVDYTVSGDTVTILKSYIETLKEGTNSLVFDFYEGADQTLTITAADTTGLDVFDDFEDYSSSDALWNSYSTNENGKEVGLELTTKNNSAALALTYNVGTDGYCGVNHPMNSRDLSSYDGVELWLEGDGSGNTFTFQLRDGNDNYFEKSITLDFTGGKTITIPFSDFNAPDWQGSGGTLDTTSVNQFSLYCGAGGSKQSGTIYLDEIILYSEESTKTGAYLIETSGTFDASSDSGVLTKLVLDGESIVSLVCNGKTLVANEDYSWNGSQVMLNNAFLGTLADGVYSITYNFSKSESDVFTLTVENSTIGGEVHTHSYKSSVTRQATCTENGIMTYTCQCGDAYTETIEATGHNYVCTTQGASCTTGGTLSYTCENCGDSYEETISPKGHNYTSDVTPATCTEDGYTTYTCSDCGDTYKDNVVKATGHTYNTKVVAPTTSSEGYTIYTCTACGHSYKDNYVPKLDGGNSDDSVTTVYFEGSASCGTWGRAVSLTAAKNGGTFDPTTVTDDGCFYLEFEGDKYQVALILQSWSGGAGWLTLKPSEVGTNDNGNYAKWYYDDIADAYGDLSTLDMLYVSVQNSTLTVTLFGYCSDASYEGGDSSDDNNGNENATGDIVATYFNGSASCGYWGQALNISTIKNGGNIDTSAITKDGYFYVEYTGSRDAIEIILQSWSGGANWLRVSPTETGTCANGYYAKWSYADVVKAYGSNLSTLDRINVGTNEGAVTVTSFVYMK